MACSSVRSIALGIIVPRMVLPGSAAAVPGTGCSRGNCCTRGELPDGGAPTNCAFRDVQSVSTNTQRQARPGFLIYPDTVCIPVSILSLLTLLDELATILLTNSPQLIQSGRRAVPSKFGLVLKSSYLPVSAAARVLASSAETVAGANGWKVRAASNAWSTVFISGIPVITTLVGRLSA